MVYYRLESLKKNRLKIDVKVWDANSALSYIDSIGLTNREDGNFDVYNYITADK